jgi:hypothetical protein
LPVGTPPHQPVARRLAALESLMASAILSCIRAAVGCAMVYALISLCFCYDTLTDREVTICTVICLLSLPVALLLPKVDEQV